MREKNINKLTLPKVKKKSFHLHIATSNHVWGENKNNKITTDDKKNERNFFLKKERKGSNKKVK